MPFVASPYERVVVTKLVRVPLDIDQRRNCSRTGQVCKMAINDLQRCRRRSPRKVHFLSQCFQDQDITTRVGSV